MEIYSLRPMNALAYRLQSKGLNALGDTADSGIGAELRPRQQVILPEDGGSGMDAMTPRQLRELAFESYQNGVISGETYALLSDELPMQTIDPEGGLVDLSAITDDTPFDFKDFYQSQLTIAKTLGDDGRALALQSVIDFLGY